MLGSLEAGRAQLQILHEFDSCCFRAAGLHEQIQHYGLWAELRAGGAFRTAVTAGNYHEVNGRDQLLVALLLERLRRGAGSLSRLDLVGLPFDDLR